MRPFFTRGGTTAFRQWGKIFNLQGRRNVTQSERASEKLISSRVKTHLSTMDFYADLCFHHTGESFSVYLNIVFEKERKTFKNNFG